MKYGYGINFSYGWEYLICFDFDVKLGIDALLKLLDFNVDILNKIERDFFNRIQNDKEFQEIIDQYYKSHIYTQKYSQEEYSIKEIVSQQLNSICHSIFAFLEGKLRVICEGLKVNFAIQEIPREGKDDLQKLYNYIKKDAKVILNKSIEKQFNILKQQKIIRNKLFHNNGTILTKDRNKVNIVEGLVLSELNKGEFKITLNKEYLLYLITTIDDFFNELILVLDSRYKNYLHEEVGHQA